MTTSREDERFMRNSRTSAMALATTVITALSAAPAAAQTTEPYSEAGATAAEIDGILVISETFASTQDDGKAEATVLGIGGEQVVGGTQEGPGEQSGNILTTGEDNPDGYLTVGGWEAQVGQDRSRGRAAVSDANLGGAEGITVTVLESESIATDERSDAETTGARIQLGEDLELVVLHANTSSTGEGESYIIAINDEKIFSSEQADGQCEIPADPLIHLICLYAESVTGEDGLTGGNAGVVDVGLIDNNITGRLFDAEAGSSPEMGGSSSPPMAPPSDDGDTSGAPAADGELPRTGGGGLFGLMGLLALGAGEKLRRFRS